MSWSRRKDDSITTIELDRPNRTADVEAEAEVDVDADEQHPLWRRVLSITFTVAVIAFTIYLWPAMLGGQTRLIIVSGHSMEPTYALRDIVVARDSGDTAVGDIVVFEVPEGEAEGMLVIHRVLEVDDEGFFITQGDNRTTPDQWQLTEENIVGKPLAHIPKGGKMLGFIQNIWVVALLVGLVALFILWPDGEEDEDAEDAEDEEQLVVVAEPVTPDPDPAARWRAIDETDALGRDVAWFLLDEPAIVGEHVLPEVPKIRVEVAAEAATTSEPSPDELAQRWLDSELQTVTDDDVMADALAWLDEQLAGVQQPVSH